MINGWPELLIEPATAKTRLDELTAEAHRLQALAVATEADMIAIIEGTHKWRESAREAFEELFEPGAGIRFHPDVARNVLQSMTTTIERAAAAHGVLLEDVVHVIVLANWIEATGGKPMAVSPTEFITQVKAKHQPQHQPPAASISPPAAPEPLGAVGWARRLTAFAVHALFWADVFGRYDIGTAYGEATARLPQMAGLAPDTVVAVTLIAWGAYLTQLKIRWLFLLPLYIAAAPPALLVKWVGGTLLGPIFKATQRIFNPAATGTGAEAAERRNRRWRKLWLLLWVVWVIALRNVEAAWVFWVPAALTLPLWYYGVKWSLASAMAPPSLTLSAVTYFSRQLDEALRAWHTKNEKERKSAVNTLAFWAILAGALCRRYSGESKLLTIQRDAIIVFSGVLLAAFGISCLWFGLLGQALFHSFPKALAGYNFLASGSLLETTLWALGCMTTAIGFPANPAPVWLKLLHAFILLTGIFQVTYLLACFSIVSATDATRVSDRVTVPLAELETKVSMALAIRESFDLRAKSGA